MLLLPVTVFGEVPEWIKNTAEWWTDGLISETEFLNAIKYLVEHNIISIESDDENDLLIDAGIAENKWKANQFTTLLELRGDTISLLADTAEVQTLIKFSEYSSSRGISFDEQFLKDNLKNRFLEFARYDPNVDQVRILDKTGVEKIRINNINGTFSLIPDNELQDKSSRYYFHEALKLQPGNVYISSIDLNTEFGEIEIPHKPTLRVATPINDSENKIMGFLIINYAMKSNLDEYSQSQFCDVSIFDENGMIITNPDESKLFGTQLGTNVSYYELYPGFEEEEEKHMSWYYDQFHDKTIIFEETDVYGSDRYWHFVCELK